MYSMFGAPFSHIPVYQCFPFSPLYLMFCGAYLFAVPFGRQTFFPGCHHRASAIDGDTTKDGRLAVCFCLLSVDVEQDLECTSHVGLWLNGQV